jgi:short-subunit dehydrogenase
MKKVSIISGGSSGLGLEMAELLMKAGRYVVILGRDSNKLIRALYRLNNPSFPDSAEYFRCNIGEEADIKRLGRYLGDNDYVVEYLFNNAGRGLFTNATGSTSALIDALFEANLKGLILLTSEILRITPEEQELSIVNIMSTSALLGRAEETIYCAAKWGARGYTEALRSELKGTKRNIIAVYPGGMKTEFWEVTGHHRDISGFMDPSQVARKIINAVLVSDGLAVTDITINRK